MAEDENENNDKTTEKSQATEIDNSNDTQKKAVLDKPYRQYPYRNGRPFFIAGIVILIILILVLIGSLFRFGQVRQGFYNRGGMNMNSRQVAPRMNGGGFFFSSSSSSSNGTTTTSTSTSFVSGVVTAVNGSSFDVGGGGTKTTINTNGSTTWNTTDKKVSVNDSVVVYGTLSGSTLTATSVQITD
ncbi:MAG TPA: hypothetical protein VMR16_00965 [Candidatus Saccharimonadales bacterium]|nr:hypothetical protein [Candidatus Saccharimonadales bacterium]